MKRATGGGKPRSTDLPTDGVAPVPGQTLAEQVAARHRDHWPEWARWAYLAGMTRAMANRWGASALAARSYGYEAKAREALARAGGGL